MSGILMRLAGLQYRLLALAFLFIASVVFSAEGDMVVIVRPGDTLSKIGWVNVGLKEQYVWQEIADYNDLDPQSSLVVGSTVLIPSNLVALRVAGAEQVSWTVQLSDESDLEESNVASDVQATPPESIEPDSVDTPCESASGCVENPAADQQAISSADESGSSTPSVQSTADSVVPESSVESSSSVVLAGEDDIDAGERGGDNESSMQSNTNSAALDDDSASPQQSQEDEVPRLPGLFDVDEDAAVRALERSLVQLNALLLDRGSIELGIEYTFSFNSLLEPVLALPPDGAEADSATPALLLFEDSDSQQFVVLDLKVGLPGDSQLSLALPFEVLESKTAARVDGVSVDSESRSLSGIGDYSVGFTKALFYEKGRLPDLLFSINYDGDSGRESSVLRTGSGADELTIGINATKRQDPLVFTFGVSHSVAEKVEGFEAGAVTRLSVGTLLAASPYTSLLLEFDQAFIAKASLDGITLADTDTSIGSLLVGASSVISQSVFLSAGLRMGLTEAATDYQFSVGMSKRFGY